MADPKKKVTTVADDGAGLMLLRQAWGLSIDVLVTRGLSRWCIDVLHRHNYVNVEDLTRLDAAAITKLPLKEEDKAALRRVCEEVLAETVVGRHPEKVPVKNTFIHFPERAPSLEQGLDARPPAPQSCPPALQGLECPTVGSKEHSTGKCEPCAWHHVPGGCWHGASCIFCHLCPEGEIKRRKRVKRELRRKGALPPKGEPGSDERRHAPQKRVVAGPGIPVAGYPAGAGFPAGYPAGYPMGLPVPAAHAQPAFPSADGFAGYDRVPPGMPVGVPQPMLPPSPHGGGPRGFGHFTNVFMGPR